MHHINSSVRTSDVIDSSDDIAEYLYETIKTQSQADFIVSLNSLAKERNLPIVPSDASNEEIKTLLEHLVQD